MYKIKGAIRNSPVNVGDKHLTMSNVEDLSSIRIFIVDDIYELSIREFVYECTVVQFKNDERPYSLS
jgi:hypothetical protein